MNILQAIKDRNLFRPFLGEDLDSWMPWLTALRALYGLPIRSRKGKDLIRQCTGRDPGELPESGFNAALFLVGRRSGKSRIAAVIGTYEALFAGHEERLAKGETGLIPVVSPTRYQSGIVWKYISALFETPLLQKEVVDKRDRERVMVLRNGLEIRILTGDWRTVRGPSVVCAILDELCFFGVTEESKVRSDTELVRALKPSLLTTKGKLIGISSKYARKGWAFQQWRRYHGSNTEFPTYSPKWRSLVWDTDSKTMNPTLSRKEIDHALEEDPAAAKSEYLGEWRDDVAEFVPRSLIEGLAAPGRKELMPRSGKLYSAFVDLSGGRADDAALAIGHRQEAVNGKEAKTVIDFVITWGAPFNPHAIIGEMVQELKRFRINRVTGDNYSAEFTKSGFEGHGIHYEKSDKPKSELYRELLPILCSGGMELLENEKLISQLAGLERRTRSGGKDIIDHPNGGKDDLANTVAGLATVATKPKIRVGAF